MQFTNINDMTEMEASLKQKLGEELHNSAGAAPSDAELVEYINILKYGGRIKDAKSCRKCLAKIFTVNAGSCEGASDIEDDRDVVNQVCQFVRAYEKLQEEKPHYEALRRQAWTELRTISPGVVVQSQVSAIVADTYKAMKGKAIRESSLQFITQCMIGKNPDKAAFQPHLGEKEAEIMFEHVIEEMFVIDRPKLGLEAQTYLNLPDRLERRIDEKNQNPAQSVLEQLAYIEKLVEEMRMIEEEAKNSKAAAEQRKKDRLEKARKEDEELAPHRLKPEEMFEGIKREFARPDHSQVNDDRYAILKSNRQRHYNAGDHDEAKRQTPAELEADRLRRQQQFAPPEPYQKVEQVVGSAYVLDAAGNLIDPKEEVKKMTA